MEWDAWQLRVANEAAGVALWSWNVDTNILAMDDRARGLWGVATAGGITFEELSARIHPEDLDKVRASFAATRDVAGAYETDFRVLHGDRVRWISARGRGDDQGIVGRIMFGIFIDVTVRKLAEEARELLTAEMNHRIRNLFAVAAALTGISARSTSTKDEMVDDLTQRLTALSNAHDLVRSDRGGRPEAAKLRDLLTKLLKPYADEATNPDRVRVFVPELFVGEKSATAFALIIHELAINSLKYGALSSRSGVLDVSCAAEDGDLVLVWKESGGPAIVAPAASKGFGSQLITRSVSATLGGSMDVTWPSEGALITLRMSKARLAA